ncbi:hypothetical protein FB451DRAFT_1497381, partial [Mycena latifolia]
DIDAQIARLQSQINAQLRLREAELKKIRNYSAAIAPIRKLPVELLVDMFLLSLVGADVFLSRKKVFSLVHVCRHWRQVALNTPHMWATPVALRPPGIKPTHYYLASTKTWLDRSSPLPLSLRIFPQDVDADLTSLMDVLLSVADRWKTIHTPYESLDTFPSLPRNAFPTLEEVSLSVRKTVVGLDICAFATAPRLQSVALGETLRKVHMPWKQLTEISVANTSPLLCRSILFACQNLETATFTISGQEEIPALPTHQLAHLKTLDVTFRNGMTASFLDSFKLPLLQSLTLSMSSRHSVWPADSFARFQLRSPKIRSLSLAIPHLNSAELVEVLHQAPGLTQLTLEMCRPAGDDQFFSALEYCSSYPPLVPQLAALNVTPVMRFSPPAVCKLVRSRWWSGERPSTVPPSASRLEEFTICGGGRDWEFRKGLQEIIDQGFVLKTRLNLEVVGWS